MIELNLQIMPETLAVCRLAASAPVPVWATGDFVSITRTVDELSIVCPQHAIPAGQSYEGEWCAIRVLGPLDFSLIGVLSSITGALAQENISVFVLSTFDTDYVLVKNHNLATAVQALDRAGYSTECY